MASAGREVIVPAAGGSPGRKGRCLTGFFNTIRPLAFALPPEMGHRLALPACRLAALLQGPGFADPILETAVAGLAFRNPVGLAAGFDKDAEVPGPMLKLGYGLVEVGSLTPRPQAGNLKPRLFRLTEDRALINRLGFNNHGFAPALRRLESFPARGRSGPVGVNIGANRDSKSPAEDYATGLKAFARVADYFVINASSPNTPGLRELQLGKNLERLLRAVRDARKKNKIRAPVFLKIAPDLDRTDLKVAVEKATAFGLDGLVVSNTTLARPSGLKSPHRDEAGGLSGAPLFKPSTEALKDAYRASRGKLALIGVGGISSGEQAFQKILAGASLVQLYTAMAYEGPGHVQAVLRGLARCLKRGKFRRVADAVGQGA